MKARTQGRMAFMLLPLAFILLLILVLLVFPERNYAPDATDAQVEAGVAWLKTQEAVSPADVEAEFKRLRQAELDEKKEQWLEQLRSGEKSVWTLFDDYAILGDSRTVGFSYYGFLDKSRVLADSGARIDQVKDYMPSLKELNPALVFLSFGINDVGIGFWPTPEDYVNKIDETFQMLDQELPDAVVYLCSILPAIDPAFDKGPAWRDIPEYNAAVKAYCKEHNRHYVDATELCVQHPEMYQPDGVHMMSDFYSLWAVNMISEVYADDFNEETTEDGTAQVPESSTPVDA